MGGAGPGRLGQAGLGCSIAKKDAESHRFGKAFLINYSNSQLSGSGLPGELLHSHARVITLNAALRLPQLIWHRSELYIGIGSIVPASFTMVREAATRPSQILHRAGASRLQ